VHVSKKKKNRRFRNALRRIARGWPVLPLFGVQNGCCECGDRECRRPGKHPRTLNGLKDASTDRGQIKKWWREHPQSNIGVVTGSLSGLVVVDVDGKEGKRSWRRLLEQCSCAPIDTLTAITGAGKHYYFDCKEHIQNSAGKFGPGLDVRADGGYVVGVGSTHVSGHRYDWEDSHKAVCALPKHLLRHFNSADAAMSHGVEDAIPRGRRNDTLTGFAGAMRRPGMSRQAIEAALLVENRYRCESPLADAEVKKIAASVARYVPVPSQALSQWPPPLAPAALYGLTGEIVSSIAPYSEVDPVGLLLHTVVFFGNAVGSSPHFLVASDRHPLNLFCVAVGQTSKARKGVAFNHTKQLFQLASPEWSRNCIETGLSSGEGLIQSILKRTTTARNSAAPSLLVFEPELGSVLRRMHLQGNTLPQVLRQAWDSSPLGVMTRKDPLKAESSHISLIGHVTSFELKELIARRDIFGGSANRILWTCVRRHGIHPELGGFPNGSLENLAGRINSALETGARVGKLTFSSRADEQWKELYRVLSSEERGVVGAVTSRGEAQVLRLSGVFALLDKSAEVRPEHLDAAAAVWKYCRESATVIFGSGQRSSLEDQIFKLLLDSANGLNRTEISEAFDNHRSGESISEALRKLEGEGRVKRITKPTKGRPAEVWSSVSGAVKE
jgi:hypothetical protein